MEVSRVYDDSGDPFFSIDPYRVTSELLFTETVELRYPPRNEEATHVKYVNRDHYTAISLAWAHALNLMFLKAEYGSKMTCFKNLDFFLESNWVKVDVQDVQKDGEDGIGVSIKFWAFTEGEHQYVDSMDMMDIEMFANIISYYGSVN